MKNKEIAVLVKALQDGKDGAFENLYEEIWDTVYYYLLKRLGNEQDAQDAVQDVFLEIHRSLDEKYHPEAFNSLLCKILIKVCDRYKRGAVIETVDLEDAGEMLEDDNGDFLPEEVLEKKEMRAAVKRLISELPDKQREAVLLYYYQDLSQSEISAVTGSSLTAVNNRLVTARKALRKQTWMFLEKGGTGNIMAAVPIITRIMMEEAKELAPPDLGRTIWEGIAENLGPPGSPPLESKAPESKPTKKADTAKRANLSNIAFSVVVVASIAGVVWAGASIYNDTRAETKPSVVEQTAYVEDDIIAELEKVTDMQQFDEFTQKYDFAFVCRHAYDGRDEYVIYMLPHGDGILYAGAADTAAYFDTAYEIADSVKQFEPENVKPWFEINGS